MRGAIGMLYLVTLMVLSPLAAKIFLFAAMYIDKDIKEQEKENEEKTEEAN